MVCSVVVVSVDDDEECIAVGVEVAVTCFGRVLFFCERIRYVEVVLIASRHGVVVTNSGSFR